MFDAVVSGFERGFRNFSEVMGAPVHTYCRLETADVSSDVAEKNLDVLVADDGSLISMLRLEGSVRHVGVADYERNIEILTEKLQSAFSGPGHLLQVVYEYDVSAHGVKCLKS
jgi:intracellular multiplication protein IcmB